MIALFFVFDTDTYTVHIGILIRILPPLSPDLGSLYVLMAAYHRILENTSGFLTQVLGDVLSVSRLKVDGMYIHARARIIFANITTNSMV